MKFPTLDAWLTYQERVNVRGIELGLERVTTAWQRLGGGRPAPVVITVGGTNGKGSTVALLEHMLQAAGYRTGCYTSPHLHRYNERIRIDAVDIVDGALMDSFERIEAARGDLLLTYFEFGTLAALDTIRHAAVDVAILEVGLGGRLDAVNIIDADVAVVTTIALDHQDWLGDNRDAIGAEKAGIARAGRPVVVGEATPPAGLLDTLARIGAKIVRLGIDFRIVQDTAGWRWVDADGSAVALPAPALAARSQYDNAAAAIAAIHALPALVVPVEAMARGLRSVSVPGRLQCFAGAPPLVVDVGHNPQAAATIARWLDDHPVVGQVHAVYGALSDKDYPGVLAELGDRVQHWHLAGLDGATPRGLPAATLAQALPGRATSTHANVRDALADAHRLAPADGLILAFGSFFVAGAVLAAAEASGQV
jgi:dihydrofolate synthase/folylpolyglutamate synthase